MRRASGRDAASALFAALLAVSLLVPAVGAAAHGPYSEGPAQAAPQQESPFAQSAIDADVVVMDVSLREDGTAEWTVSFRTRLEDENATAAFESIRADVEANASAYTEQFGDRMRRTANAAENATGREMRVENVTVTAAESQPLGEYGVLTYRFRWTDFAVAEGDRIEAGDAVSGLFLDGQTRLIVRWPEGYDERSVAPEPSERYEDRVVWQGPVDFAADEPRVTVGRPGPLSALSTPVAVVGALLAAAVVAGVLFARRGAVEFDRVPVPGSAADADGDGGEGSDGESDDAGDEADEPPEELLSNEERVLRLLEDNGGRIKQQEVAERLDWTDAKTSQVVGKLRDADEVETFRIGRENVLALPEESDF